MNKETRETMAVAIGGVAMAYMLFVAAVEMVRIGGGVLLLLLGPLILWREYVFAGMRREITQRRRQT